jgi:hypothetical protein
MWYPPVEPSAAEQVVIKAVRRAKLFVLRQVRNPSLLGEVTPREAADSQGHVKLGSVLWHVAGSGHSGGGLSCGFLP